MGNVHGVQVYPLESKTFADSGNAIISLKDLPPGRRVTGVLLRLSALVTQAGGTGTAFPALEQKRAFAAIRVGRRIRVSGTFLRCLNWLQLGHNFGNSAGVPAANGAYRREIQVMLPFSDYSSANPGDGAVPSEFFKDTPIEIDWGVVATILGTGTLAGTCRALAFHEPSQPNYVPASQVLGYEDWGQQEILLKPGLYTHIFLFNEDGSTMTDGEVATVSMWVDGEQVYSSIKAGELLSMFNYFTADGTALETASDTAPVGGEELTDEPGVADAAATTITTQFLPLFAPSAGYLLSKCLMAERGIRIQLAGTDTSLRVGYRMIEAKSNDGMVRAAHSLGVGTPSSFTPKTASKVQLPNAAANPLAKYLPAKLG
jgi:hypothetical protein